VAHPQYPSPPKTIIFIRFSRSDSSKLSQNPYLFRLHEQMAHYNPRIWGLLGRHVYRRGNRLPGPLWLNGLIAHNRFAAADGHHGDVVRSQFLL